MKFCVLKGLAGILVTLAGCGFDSFQTGITTREVRGEYNRYKIDRFIPLYRVQANKMFDNSYKLYSLFWGLNTKMVNLGEVKRDVNDVYLVDEKAKKFEKVSVFSKLNDFVQKALDCCRE